MKPKCAGIYCIFEPNGNSYLGATNDLVVRQKAHMRSGQFARPAFEVVEIVDDPALLQQKEDEYFSSMKFELNTQKSSHYFDRAAHSPAGKPFANNTRSTLSDYVREYIRCEWPRRPNDRSLYSKR